MLRSNSRLSLTPSYDGTTNPTHHVSRRRFNQLEAARKHGLRLEKHAGIGIALIWIKYNIWFKKRGDCLWSAMKSVVALQQANEIDAEIIQRINPVFGLDDWRRPAPTYNIDILFACINKSCTTHALGFHLNLPKTSNLVTIENVSSLLQNDSDFMGVILRLGSLSATAGTIAVYKKRGVFRFFTHQFGFSEVGPAALIEFFGNLSKTAGFMNYKHACFFEVVPFTPDFFRRTSSSNRDGASASASAYV
ncbi:hypothetical protein [Endozoicomonas euniceicola]|uniref:Uncharacterized protein n=1 Tax=Endozoicomonas euniceicola TaxID=1234143 RepID=A0ABY6GV55_9GAMM|nr:hypothetical protein [Endozoicomonas euniceicola]UYM15844.1 hypothetical protein NX720_23965 [Endozoicomonas euniceicola]